jgi:hypothetical protein
MASAACEPHSSIRTPGSHPAGFATQSQVDDRPSGRLAQRRTSERSAEERAERRRTSTAGSWTTSACRETTAMQTTSVGAPDGREHRTVSAGRVLPFSVFLAATNVIAITVQRWRGGRDGAEGSSAACPTQQSQAPSAETTGRKVGLHGRLCRSAHRPNSVRRDPRFEIRTGTSFVTGLYCRARTSDVTILLRSSASG